MVCRSESSWDYLLASEYGTRPEEHVLYILLSFGPRVLEEYPRWNRDIKYFDSSEEAVYRTEDEDNPEHELY